jgi:phosphatidylglycerophosphatase C
VAGAETPVVAAFDLDGTLAARDTLLPFLRRLCGRRRVAIALVRHGASITSMLVGRRDRDEVKAALLSDVLRDVPAGGAGRLGEDYAGDVVAQLRPGVLTRLREHQRLGHTVVIVSASPAIYVRPVARRLGIEAVLATELDVAGGTFTGRLAGANCRGPEKARRLREWLGSGAAVVHAYGDSSGDRELLELADFAYWTRRGRVPPISGPSRPQSA